MPNSTGIPSNQTLMEGVGDGDGYARHTLFYCNLALSFWAYLSLFHSCFYYIYCNYKYTRAVALQKCIRMEKILVALIIIITGLYFLECWISNFQLSQALMICSILLLPTILWGLELLHNVKALRIETRLLQLRALRDADLRRAKYRAIAGG